MNNLNSELHTKGHTEFDPVNKPKHYNTHPSGVQCIEITQHMGFNLGNAFKYVFRAEEKNGVQDIDKAIWYVKNEIKLRNEGYISHSDLPRSFNYGVTVVCRINSVIEQEENSLKAAILHSLWASEMSVNHLLTLCINLLKTYRDHFNEYSSS